MKEREVFNLRNGPGDIALRRNYWGFFVLWELKMLQISDFGREWYLEEKSLSLDKENLGKKELTLVKKRIDLGIKRIDFHIHIERIP